MGPARKTGRPRTTSGSPIRPLALIDIGSETPPRPWTPHPQPWWGDIDWSRPLIFVRRSFTVDDDGPTKSGKVRSVPFVAQAARALERLAGGSGGWAMTIGIFVNDVGDEIESSALRRRFYRPLENAGLDHIRFHYLGHTFGTIAVQASR